MIKSEISIIVPIYNVEKYLPKCLDSLITQSYKKIKIWAIVDGSPDQSIDIVRDYQKKDNRIILVDKENGGYGSALEYAISSMESEFFLVCDPDDWLDREAVEILYSNAENDHLDIVIANRKDVYIDNNESVEIDVGKDNWLISDNVIYTGVEVGRMGFCTVTPHSKLFRTEICKNIRFEHKVNYTDFTLFLVALNNASRVKKINNSVSYYLCDRPGNTATDFSEKMIHDTLIVSNSTLNQIIDNQNPYLLLKMFYKYFHLLSLCNTLKNKIDTTEYLEKVEVYLSRIVPYKKTLMKFCDSNKKRVVIVLFTNKILKKTIARAYLKKRGII